MNNKKKRALTGITPSGEVHLGNYLGMLKPALSYQNDYECLYFISDMHALTRSKDANAIRHLTLDLAATWISLGLDVDAHVLFCQSHLPMATEFAWYLSCCTGVGFLEKAHAYKDAQANNREINHGFLAYPVLMAADILMYDVDIVPVGKDQKQHVEMARDMAGAFNAAYARQVMKLPEPVIREEVMVIPGLDGRKMSKSYDNTIPLFCSEKELKSKVMSLKTDSTPLEAPKSLKNTLIGELFSLFATRKETEDLEQRLQKGGLGWGHAKLELFEVINREIAAPRLRFNELRQEEGRLKKILADGAEKAYAIAEPILARVRECVGFNASCKFLNRP